MRSSALCVTAAFLLAGGAAIAQDQPGHQSPAPGSNTEAVSAAEDAVSGMVGRVTADMTSSTQGFVTAAAVGDMYEVAAGRIALERATTPAVKAFAQRMVAAHTETTEKLKSVLAGNSIKVAQPTHVDNRRQGMLDNLRGASAEDFEHRYISQQVAAHKEADTLMRGYAQDGDNQAAKDFARETDGHVKAHLSLAERLDRVETARR